MTELEVVGARSFVAGLSAGMASTIAGYVPDTIKVEWQWRGWVERVEGRIEEGELHKQL